MVVLTPYQCHLEFCQRKDLVNKDGARNLVAPGMCQMSLSILMVRRTRLVKNTSVYSTFLGQPVSPSGRAAC